MYTYIQHNDCFCRPFLKAVITRAIFHVDGNVPFCNKKLKMIVNGIQMVQKYSLTFDG